MTAMTAKRKIIICISWLLAAACMAIIFALSAQVADDSSELSLMVMDGFMSIFTNLQNAIGHDAFRSIAHALEYCGLALLLFNAYFQTLQKPKIILSFITAVIYALTDEIHQIFVEGRAFQLTDIAVDAAGSALGVAAGFVIYIVINYTITHYRGNGLEKE